MNEVKSIINCLGQTPIILQGLLKQIPREFYSKRRLHNKWSIHEQICHLVEAQEILTQRFRQFELEKNPLIQSYVPLNDRSTDYYHSEDLELELSKFPDLRKDMIIRLKSFDEEYWELEGRHELFTPYNTRLLLTHALNVDYAHLFSIEQLGLTKLGLEKNIMTLP